ncbi:MAG: hypothetical protein AMQ74_01951 [Candidatus Methanofastidiosum methylothiophilum]|uniref:Gene product 88 domain-containing protein n=1 Tax=Candidatus Methanofastidiosum methylothiophilum TaxID=1705564 RepID=A0A150IIR7_9EURY|nr:MAG: hypothetical protein AMQ74_01951 [Candidatus Methanofastidiosum methylthiophilus]
MEGMISINTNPMTNTFCLSLIDNKDLVCGHCYSVRALKSFRARYQLVLEKNSRILSSRILDSDRLPRVTEDIMRINSFGELINQTHLQNIFNLARVNPRTTFALWTKRKDLINRTQEIPDNTILIYSIPKLNPKNLIIPPKFHKVFAVYTKQYARENNIEANCGGRRCRECLKCYTFGEPYIIKEFMK